MSITTLLHPINTICDVDEPSEPEGAMMVNRMRLIVWWVDRWSGYAGHTSTVHFTYIAHTSSAIYEYTTHSTENIYKYILHVSVLALSHKCHFWWQNSKLGTRAFPQFIHLQSIRVYLISSSGAHNKFARKPIYI